MKKYIGFLIVLSVLVGFSQIQASNTASGVVNDDCTSGTAPWIKVISPAGGETFITGQQIVIKWTSCNVQNVYLSLAQGAHDKGNLVDNMPATPGSYQWTIPFSDPSLPNNNYHIGVFSVNLTPGVQGISGAFNINGTGGITTPTVSAPAITVPTQVTSAQQTVNTKVPEITTNSVNTASSPIFFNRALTVGSQGNDVKALQNILKQKGFLAKKTIATGYFGTQTQSAVKRFQKDANFINTTGTVDNSTLAVINGTQAEAPVAIPDTSIAPSINPNTDPLVIDPNSQPGKIIIPPATVITPTISPLPAVYGPSISVLSPNGGEVINVSNPVTVAFQSSNVYPAKHYINLVDETIGKSYSLDSLLGTYGLMLTQAQVNQSQQSIIVSIPASYNLSTNDKYKIEICVNNVCDKSDDYFQITTTPVVAGAPSIHITASSNTQVSDSYIQANIGDVITIAGIPQNLNGLSYYLGTGYPPAGYFNRAYYFDQNFSNNNSCGNNEANATGIWTMTCTAKVVGSTYVYIDIYANNGQVYKSNTVNIAIVNPNIHPLPPIIDPGTISPTSDITPRVMFWSGKVNQHVDQNGNWQTDADGTSGANIDRLTYCKKFFPNTVSVSDYKIEGIGTWKDRGNVQNPNNPASYYYTLKMSTKCVQGNSIDPAPVKIMPPVATIAPAPTPLPPVASPSITVLSPNGGEQILKGTVYRIKWNSQGISQVYLKLYKAGVIYHDPFVLPETTIIGSPVLAASGYFDWLVPTSIPNGSDYVVQIATGDAGTIADFSDNTFTINSPTPTPLACTLNVAMSPTTSSAQTVNPGQNGVSLAKFNLTPNCNVNVNGFAVSLLPLPNGYKNISSLKLYSNGSQIGSTIFNPNMAGLNFGNLNFQISAGQTAVFEAKGDISSTAVVGSTVYATFGGSTAVNSSDNTMVGNNASGNIIAGNVVTIGNGSVTSCSGPLYAKTTFYPNQTTHPYSPNYKIGSYIMQNNCNEPIRITNLNIGIVQNSSAVPISDLSNLIPKDSSGNVLSNPIQPTYSNNFAVDFIIQVGQSYFIDVDSDIGPTPSGTVQSIFGYNGVGVNTNTAYPAGAPTTAVAGQLITISASVPVGNNSF